MNRWTILFASLALVFGIKLMLLKSQREAMHTNSPVVCEGGKPVTKNGITHFVGPTNSQCETPAQPKSESRPKETETGDRPRAVTPQEIAAMGFNQPGTDLEAKPTALKDGKKKKKKKKKNPDGTEAPETEEAVTQTPAPDIAEAETPQTNEEKPEEKKPEEPKLLGGNFFAGLSNLVSPKSKDPKEEEKPQENQSDKWTQLLTNDPSFPSGRSFVLAYRIGEMKEDEFYTVIENTFRNPDVNVRKISIFALSQEKKQRSFNMLADASVSDPEPAIRNLASKGLLEYRDIRYVSILSQVLSSGNVSQRIRAAEVVAQLASFYAGNKQYATGAYSGLSPLVAALELAAKDTSSQELQKEAKSALDLIKGLANA